MKKIFLSIAVCVALVIGGTSCKSSTVGPNSKMECWEYTFIDVYGNSESGYMWELEDYMKALKAYCKKHGVGALEYKQSSKYKTAEDCVDAGCYILRYGFGG